MPNHPEQDSDWTEVGETQSEQPGVPTPSLGARPSGFFRRKIQARVNLKSMQMAREHAKAFGELMDVAAQTMEQIHKAQDMARQYQARQYLAGELYGGEVERQREAISEVKDQRELAKKQRQVEQIKADTEILAVQQAYRAKKKFEKHKHAAGEARFEGKIADRKLGTAAAKAAMDEAGAQSPPDPQEESAEPERNKSDATVFSLVQEFIKLQDDILEGERDGRDTMELRSDRDALKRLIERLQKKPD